MVEAYGFLVEMNGRNMGNGNNKIAERVKARRF